MTHYEVLGVSPAASADDLRRAYVVLARRHHPDFHTTASPADRAEAERRMQAVNQAWRVVGDPGRRAAYDRSLGVGGDARPDPGFRPLDADDDAVDVDPLTVADAPYRREPPRVLARQRAATLVPVALFASAVATFVLGLVLAAVPLLALGAGLLLVSCAGFVVLPLVVMARATRDEG